MTLFSDDLTNLRDDMIAFIEGHGMKRFPGTVEYEFVPSVLWKSDKNPDSWKDFVELAKASGAPFLTMEATRLQREEIDDLIERLSSSEFGGSEEIDVDEARWLRTYIGKTGFVQLGFAHQGIMMIFEATTEWYMRYQHLVEAFEEMGIPIDMDIDEPGPDGEV
jgi:hypothetical protein